MAYSPLGHGFLTGTLRTPEDLRCLDDTDFRKNNPRVTGENFERNLRLADEVQAVADQVGALDRVTPAEGGHHTEAQMEMIERR